jgi:DNA repair protein RadC
LHDPAAERIATDWSEMKMERTPPNDLPADWPEITTAEAAHLTLRSLMTNDVEEFWALALGPTKRLLRSEMIFRGTVDACLVHPRDIFRFGVLANASGLVVAHNHPSGDLRPSEQDLLFTRQLIHAARVIEIPLLDHLIVTKAGFSSFAREGWAGLGATPATGRGRRKKWQGAAIDSVN